MAKEKEADKEIEEELTMYKKEAMKQHENDFSKAVDLGLFEPFKDVKDNVLLDEEDIAIKDEVGEKQGAEEQDNDATV